MSSAAARLRSPRGLIRTLAAWALAAASAAAFSAPQLLPTAELSRHALRARTDYAESVSQREAVNPEHQLDAFQSFVYRPDPAVGRALYAADRTLNPLLLVLGLAGVVAARRRREAWPLLLAGALGLALALGERTPVYRVFYELGLPGANVLKKAARYLFLTHAALALAGAVAADRLWSPRARGQGAPATTAILATTSLFSVAAVALTIRGRGPDPAPGGLEAMAGVWTVFGLAMLFEAGAGRPKLHRRLARAATVVGFFAAFQHFWGGLRAPAPWEEVRRLTTPPAWAPLLLSDGRAPRLLQFAAHEPFESWPNRFAPFGVEEAGGFSSLILERTMLYAQGAAAAWPLDQYANPALLQNVNARRAAAVGFVAVDPARAAEPTLAYLQTSGFEKSFEDEAAALYRDPGALPRAYWVAEAETAADDAAALARLADPSFPPDRRVLLDGREGPAPAPSDGAPAAVPAEFRRPSNWEIEVRLDAPASGWVVAAETAYPGWRAELDGRPVPWRTANFLFRAIEVPAGARVVRMVFDPFSFRLGAWVFLAGALGAAVALLQRPARRLGAARLSARRSPR